MKYKVVGWTDWESDDFANGFASEAVCNAIVDCIKEKGFCFSGYDHQESFCGVPVLNDGKMRRFSQRGWGKLMAEAHGLFGPFDYSSFAYSFGKKDGLVLPDIAKDYLLGDFAPETNLCEKFTVEVDESTLKSVIEASKIKLDDIPYFRYLDAGDTLNVKCESECVVCKVIFVERKQELDLQEYKEHLRKAIQDGKHDEYEASKSPTYIFVELEIVRIKND